MFANVHISKIKKAKAIVVPRMMDAQFGEYGKFFDYWNELLRSNPGSMVIVKLHPDFDKPTFYRFYVCFEACRKGFLAGCRKVIGLDGCFFKGRAGELLCAVGRDANNQIYPIAWAAVDKETNYSWDWFCSILFNELKLGDGEGWVIISDQQKGILNAVQNWTPRAEHRNCARHIYANWRKKFRNKDWQKLFWACAKAPCEMVFNKARAILAQHTPDGAKAIMEKDPHHWSRAWFKLGSDCDSVDNNICESFNKWIVQARYLPIISMLEAIRRKVMMRIQEMITQMDKWAPNVTICPNITTKLKKSINQSAYCETIFNGKDSYEVKLKEWGLEHRFTVKLEDRTCSCRYWQLSGLPCAHAIACIYFHTSCLDDYIAKCYHVEEFRKTYEHCLQLVEGMPAWPISNRPRPVAPGHIAMPGRKKKSRTREPEEKPGSSRVSRAGTTIRCGRCKQYGHNKSSCAKRTGGLDPTPQMPSQQSNRTTPSTQPQAATSMSSEQRTTASTKRKASTQSEPSNSKRSHAKGSNKKTSRKIVNEVHGLEQGSQASSSITRNMSSRNDLAKGANETSRKK